MPKRVTVTVLPSSEHPDFLTVQDAMLQIADAFALLRGEGAAGFEWKLVTASTNSPFTTVGEVIAMPGAGEAVYASALLATHETYQGLTDVLDGDEPPPILDQTILKRLFARNLNGVGITRIEGGDGYGAVSLTPANSRAGLEAIKSPPPPLTPKRSRGTLEGFLVDAGQYRKQPALKLKERVRGRIIWCRIPKELESQFAEETSLRDIWRNSRVRIRGWIEYSSGGKISGMSAEQITHVHPGRVSDSELFDRSFTSGLGSVRYVDRLRDGDLA